MGVCYDNRNSMSRGQTFLLTEVSISEIYLEMENEPVCGQAAHIIGKFGGARRLAELLTDAAGTKVAPSIVYRWTYPRDRGGTHGFIPTQKVPQIMQLADLLGIELTTDDWVKR